jgi:hypothetical protein
MKHLYLVLALAIAFGVIAGAAFDAGKAGVAVAFGVPAFILLFGWFITFFTKISMGNFK